MSDNGVVGGGTVEARDLDQARYITETPATISAKLRAKSIKTCNVRRRVASGIVASLKGCDVIAASIARLWQSATHLAQVRYAYASRGRRAMADARRTPKERPVLSRAHARFLRWKRHASSRERRQGSLPVRRLDLR